MEVKIRMQRAGDPAQKNYNWRIVAISKGTARDGKILEILGHYDPAKKPASYDLVVEYFSSTPLPDEDVFEFGLSGQVERLKDRSQLERNTFPIRSAKEAEQYDTPVGSMTLVTFVR